MPACNITQQLQAGSRNAVAESLQPKKGRYKPEVENSHESQEGPAVFALITWGSVHTIDTQPDSTLLSVP